MATKAKIRLYSIQKETKLRNSLGCFSGCVLPNEFRRFSGDIEHFEVRDDDIWITGFPRTGTTWLQEMVWLLGNNIDYEQAKIDLHYRFPVLEFTPIMQDRINYLPKKLDFPPIPNSVHEIAEIEGRRFIKTHLPWDLLPLQIRDGNKTPKIINIIRNPKDVCVSYFHYQKLIPGPKRSLNDHFNDFVSDKLVYTPFWGNIHSYWSRRDHPNLLVITYEEMKKNICSATKKVANFLEFEATNDEVSKLGQHLHFDRMRKNKALNFEPMVDHFKKLKMYQEDPGCFMRIGKVGSYRDELTEEMIQMMNIWIRQNTADTGLRFDEFLLM